VVGQHRGQQRKLGGGMGLRELSSAPTDSILFEWSNTIPTEHSKPPS
jgi:hypothetical protein